MLKLYNWILYWISEQYDRIQWLEVGNRLICLSIRQASQFMNPENEVI
jgi:hypothetical protein